ncbi:MAG: hypothetical protein IT534_09790 [Bauldia sp.]|nr:hypothetical protein [Bauldia sp.]
MRGIVAEDYDAEDGLRALTARTDEMTIWQKRAFASVVEAIDDLGDLPASDGIWGLDECAIPGLWLYIDRPFRAIFVADPEGWCLVLIEWTRPWTSNHNALIARAQALAVGGTRKEWA